MSIIECDEIVVGCDNITRLTALDIDKEPVSLTGERVRLAISRNLIDAPVIVKDSDVGVSEIEILAAPNDNQALIKINASDLDGLEEGTYCRAVQIFFSALGICVIPVNGTVDIVHSPIANIP